MTEAPGAAMAANLDAALDRLEAEAPGPAARGRLALRRALAWTSATAWPEVAWSFSDLADGLPVELVWRPGEPGLFWTAEPAAPEWPPQRRLARVLDLAERGGRWFAAEDRALLGRLADAAPSPWPLWLAGRHRGMADAAKIYVRLGPGSLDLAARRLAPLLPALRAGDLPSMLGLEPDGGLEFYWRRDVRQAGDRYRLSRLPGIATAIDRLQRALRDWTGAGLDDPVSRRIGLSLKLGPDARVVAAAAFLRASAVADPDTLRRRLLEAGGDRNPALAELWAEGRLRPMLLTLAATEDGVRPALGFTLVRRGLSTGANAGRPLREPAAAPERETRLIRSQHPPVALSPALSHPVNKY